MNTVRRTREVKRRIVCILRLGDFVEDVVFWYCVRTYEVKLELNQASRFGKMGIFKERSAMRTTRVPPNRELETHVLIVAH